MFEVQQTSVFTTWLAGLKDIQAKRSIAERIYRARAGLLGDVKFFDGIGELRTNHGPGYRLYFVRRGARLIVLLCGGDKSTQSADIRRAVRMAKEV